MEKKLDSYTTQVSDQLTKVTEHVERVAENTTESEETRRKIKKRQEQMVKLDDKFDLLIQRIAHLSKMIGAKVNATELTAMVEQKSLFTELPTNDEDVLLKIVEDSHRRYVHFQKLIVLLSITVKVIEIYLDNSGSSLFSTFVT